MTLTAQYRWRNLLLTMTNTVTFVEQIMEGENKLLINRDLDLVYFV